MAFVEVDDGLAPNIQELSKGLSDLLDSTPMPLYALENMAEARVGGVYVISHVNHAAWIYAGQSACVARRMNDHRTGNACSDLPVMVHREGLDIAPMACTVRWHPVADEMARDRLELFAIAVLRCTLNC